MSNIKITIHEEIEPIDLKLGRLYVAYIRAINEEIGNLQLHLSDFS